MDYALRHRGTITNISGRKLSVAIAATADCAGCAVRSVCHPSGKIAGDTVIEARLLAQSATAYSIGDTVEVGITTSGRMRAIMFALALPCMLLIATILLVGSLGMTQIYAALSGIATVLIYYAVLYALRRKVFATPSWVVITS